MSLQVATNSLRNPVSRNSLSNFDLPRFLCSLALVLALVACISAPAGADVLFPHNYGNGQFLTFSGGTTGKDYELRIAQPGGDIVKASEALLDVSFLDHRRIMIQPQNVAPDVYRAFYGPGGGGGSKQVLAAVYVAGTDTLVDPTLVINTTYDPSPHFQNATFTGNQRWTTSVDAVAGETQTISFSWIADHGGAKNWQLGNPPRRLSVRCENASEFVAILPIAEAHSDLATLVASETDTTGTSGQVSIRFTAPAYNLEGSNDYTVRIYNQQDPYHIGGEGSPTGCSGSALDVQIVVTRGASVPAVAHVLFPNGYGSGQDLDFSGGVAGGNYELRVERPAGGMVNAKAAFLEAAFLSHSQVRIASRRVSPEVYLGFHSPMDASGHSRLPAAVYVAGTDTLVDGALVVDAVYDPSPQFRDATFTGNQRWTTSVDAIEGTTTAYSFSWQAVYAGDKNWGVGDLAANSLTRCQIGMNHVAILPPVPTDSMDASLITDDTGATGNSGTVSIEFTAPAYDPDGSNDYTVRIYNRQDPNGIDNDDSATGCNGSALDVRITVSHEPQILPGEFEDGDARLVNGATPNEGRLEMYFDGQWGTFCDDYWTDDDADVACRQLGYEQGSVPNGGRFLQSHFGPADEGVPIWLDNLLCNGDEAGLMDCARAPQPEGTDLGQHNCSLKHLEDVGVRCETGEPALLSVAGASAKEGGALYFQVTLSRPRESETRVDYATSDGTAMAGADYVAAAGTLFFYAGELTKTVAVTVLDDVHDDDGETLTLTLSNPLEARIVIGEATGTIVNSDPLPKAWMARFGRTIAGHLVDAMQARLETPPESYVRLGGYRLDTAAGPEDAVLSTAWTPGTDLWSQTEPAATAKRDMTTRQLLSGSAFHLVSNEDDPGQFHRLSAWGRITASGFDGQTGNLPLDGTVTTAMLGVDGVWNHWLTGVVLAQSEGGGSFGSVALPGGEIDSRLTSVHPYVAYMLNESAWVWGIGGFGEGSLTLTPIRGAELETDIGLTMAAVGARRALLATARGLNLALETDGFWVRTTSDAVPGLVATDAVVSRARLGLKSTYVMILHSGSAMTPKFGIGLRHDAGDAETGWGVEVSSGFAWSAALPGLSVEVEARSLIGHQVSDFRDWSLSGLLRYDPNPFSERGLSASLRSSMGTAAWGGADALLGLENVAELTGRPDPASGQLNAEAAYGLPILGGRFTGAPWIGAGVLEHQRDYLIGYRVSPARQSASDIHVDVEGLQRHFVDGQAEQAIRVRFARRW